MNSFILNSKNIKRDAYVWNTISSTLLAGMSALLLIIVVRFLEDLDAAIFSLGFSIAQMMLTIGYFDMRAYQSTDVKKVHSFKRYFTSRTITCILMLIVSVIYILLNGYEFYKGLIIFMLCVFKMFDAFEDVIHGLFQVNGRLDIAGKLQTIRIVACIVGFTLSIILTKNLLFSITLVILLSILIIVVFNFPIISHFDKLEFDWEYKCVIGLILTCLPLCIGSFLNLYIGNSPKYAIDVYLDPVYQTYFNILFMPSYVVNLFCGFALRPTLTTLALHYNEGRLKEYKKTIFKLVMLIATLTVLIEVAAFLLGIPVLSLVYGVNLSAYRLELLILILAGSISSVGTVVYYALTIMRNQKLLLISYIVTFMSAIFLSPYLVDNFGMMGASVSTLLLYFIRTFIFILIFIVCFKRNTKGNA